MKIIDMYIAKTIAVSTFLVLLVLLTLFMFVDFVAELDDVGRGNYNIGDAVKYVLLSMPRRMAELMPVTSLLGTTLGLGILANSSELTAIRSAGVSVVRIAWSAVKFGFVFIILVFIISEVIAPPAERWGQLIRTNAMNKTNTTLLTGGFWTRDRNSFIYAKDVLSSKLLSNVEIYETDRERLKSITRAEFARYLQGKRWELLNVKRTQLSDDGALTENKKQDTWHTELEPDLLDVVKIRPQRLAVWDLYLYANFLNDSKQDALQYAQAFWKKVSLPVVIIVMICISIPFIFGPLRSVAIGNRIVVGTLLGITFHVFDQMVSHMGQVWQSPPLLTAFFPTLCFMAVTVWLMRSVH